MRTQRVVMDDPSRISGADDPVGAGGVVEGVRKDKLRFARETGICRATFSVLTGCVIPTTRQ